MVSVPQPDQDVALRRLKELGVVIKEYDDFLNFVIPSELNRPKLVETGFLLAQLDRSRFPEGFAGLSDLAAPPAGKTWVRYVDSHPHGLEYRVYKR